jgi:hypothetical protein
MELDADLLAQAEDGDTGVVDETDADDEGEGVPPVAETPAPKKRGRKPKADGEKKQKKAEKPVFKESEKVMKTILKKAGLTELPTLESLLVGKVGQKVTISQIGIFIGEPESETLTELAAKFTVKNNINLSAEVQLDNVIRVGIQILQHGRMFQPITVAKVGEAIECTSGRHRLAFLALAYGTDIEIPVYVEEMDINTARDAVVVSNTSRKAKAMEQIEHAVLASARGNIDAAADETYKRLSVSARKANQYRGYLLLDLPADKKPTKFTFGVSKTSSRKDGSLTTVKNVMNFWNAAIPFLPEVSYADFISELKASVKFLNQVVSEMKKLEGFDPKHQLASMTLVALGSYYRGFITATNENPVKYAEKIANVLVGLGEIGRQTSGVTLQALSVGMNAK